MNSKQWTAKGSRVDAPDGSCVCLCSSNRQDGPANAEFICRAVNSHEALVTALRKIRDGLFATKKLEGHLSDTLRESLTHHIATARAAIALAMGNEPKNLAQDAVQKCGIDNLSD